VRLPHRHIPSLSSRGVSSDPGTTCKTQAPHLQYDVSSAASPKSIGLYYATIIHYQGWSEDADVSTLSARTSTTENLAWTTENLAWRCGTTPTPPHRVFPTTPHNHP